MSQLIFISPIRHVARAIQDPQASGANGSLMEKHFTTLETDFTLETLLPWRKGTFFFIESVDFFLMRSIFVSFLI